MSAHAPERPLDPPENRRREMAEDIARDILRRRAHRERPDLGRGALDDLVEELLALDLGQDLVDEIEGELR